MPVSFVVWMGAVKRETLDFDRNKQLFLLFLKMFAFFFNRRAFFTEANFSKHMAKGVHRPTKLRLKDYVFTMLAERATGSVQLSTKHTRATPSIPDQRPTSQTMQSKSYVSPFAQGWGRKQKRVAGKRVDVRVKVFLRSMFMAGFNENGKINRSKKVSKETACRRLAEKIAAENWPTSSMLTAKQIGGHFAQFKAMIQKKSFEYLATNDVLTVDLPENFEEDSGDSDTEPESD
jgi:hypothetical protein